MARVSQKMAWTDQIATCVADWKADRKRLSHGPNYLCRPPLNDADEGYGSALSWHLRASLENLGMPDKETD